MKSIALIFTCLFCTIGFAQKNAPEFLSKAQELYDKKEYKAALPLFQRTADVFKDAKNWQEFTKIIRKISYCQLQTDNSVGALSTLESALSVIQHEQPNSIEEALIWNEIARLNKKQFNFNASLQACQKAISIFEKLHTLGDEPAYAYKTAAQIFIRRIDYENTHRYYEKSIQVDTANTYLTSNRYNLAISYFYEDNPKESLRQAQLGFDSNHDEEYTAYLQQIAAGAYEKLGNLNEAERLLKLALTYFQREKDSESLKDLYDSLASIYQKKKNPQKAQSFYEKSIAECKKAFPKKNREFAKTLVNQGDFYESQGQLNKAAQTFHKAIIQVFHSFNEADFLKNPSIESAYVESFGMTAPAKKASVLLKLAQSQTNKTPFLQAAAAAFDLSFACVHQLREGYSDESTKLELAEHVHLYLEKALETQRLLYELTHETAHLNRFFQLMEENKAAVLAEALQKNHAFEAAGIPDSILQREALLRRDLADARANLQTEDPTDQKSIEKIKLHIAGLEKEQASLFEKIRTQFPDFQRLSAKPPTPDLAQFFSRLHPNQTFLEFFEGETAIFILVIHDSQFEIRRLEKADLNDDLLVFRQFFTDKTKIEAAPKAYFELAFRLFEKICPISEDCQTLFIVPDGQFGFLPFEALLTQKGWGGGFATAPFLLKKVQISEAWSAALWLNPISFSEKTATKRVAFSPIFKNNERDLSPLLNSPDEVQHADFQSFSGSEATVFSFQNETKNNLAVLHLSTHATADSLPRIEFFDQSMPLHEIYAARLRAELVVLSACETGIGRIKRGEGLMSLARAFSYAGAKSLVASLWNVNERSTAQLFTNFYEQMSEGKSRSTALREAKLSVLNSTEMDARKSPYFWAGFIFIGEDGFLQKEFSWKNRLLMSMLFLTLISVFKRVFRKS